MKLEQTSQFGKHGFAVSRFGMGCMRLPTVTSADGKAAIDEAESVRMIRYAVDQGVNYFDTAYGYGDSERVVGKALAEGYREKVVLATKSPSWLINSHADFDRYLDEELARLQTERIDVYLLHAMRQSWWDGLRRHRVFRFLEDAKKRGRIRYAGFSFHDQLALFKEIVDAYDWDVCQIQLNYMDDKMQAGVEGLAYAAAKGLPVVIMEPLKGGTLVNKLPEEAVKLLRSDVRGMTPVYLAFRWLCSLPAATVILSGVSSMEQLREDIEIFADMPDGPLDAKERTLLRKVKAVLNRSIKIGCTGCGYCLPCPSGVAIPDVLKLYNDVFMLDHLKVSKVFYQDVFGVEKKDASRCTECGRCEKKCPQQLEIIGGLKEVDALLRRPAK